MGPAISASHQLKYALCQLWTIAERGGGEIEQNGNVLSVNINDFTQDRSFRRNREAAKKQLVTLALKGTVS